MYTEEFYAVNQPVNIIVYVATYLNVQCVCWNGLCMSYYRYETSVCISKPFK